jgi:Glutaredoxin-like domain (DUF836)
MTATGPDVRLYVKPGCHLCEDAAAALGRLRPRYPHRLTLVDITADTGLLERYGQRIPVLTVGGREYAAPLFEATLERALRAEA